MKAYIDGRPDKDESAGFAAARQHRCSSRGQGNCPRCCPAGNAGANPRGVHLRHPAPAPIRSQQSPEGPQRHKTPRNARKERHRVVFFVLTLRAVVSSWSR